MYVLSSTLRIAYSVPGALIIARVTVAKLLAQPQHFLSAKRVHEGQENGKTEGISPSAILSVEMSEVKCRPITL
jgi:hypothetical protein